MSGQAVGQRHGVWMRQSWVVAGWCCYLWQLAAAEDRHCGANSKCKPTSYMWPAPGLPEWFSYSSYCDNLEMAEFTRGSWMAPGNCYSAYVSRYCYCDCTTVNSVTCDCKMDVDYEALGWPGDFHYCYKWTTPCPTYGPGYFNWGCRCSLVDSSTWIEESSQWVTRKEWECSPGKIAKCPPGHYCPGQQNLQPTPCPDGQFNPYEWQYECQPCKAPPGYYTHLPLTTPCDKVTGEWDTGLFQGAFQKCDKCTLPFLRKGETMSSCPPYDPTFHADYRTGTCQNCSLCGTYDGTLRGPMLGATALLPRYADGASRCITDLQSACVFTFAYPNKTLSKEPTMKFVYGQKRVPGMFSLNIDTNDTLASYQPCPAGSFTMPNSMVRSQQYETIRSETCVAAISACPDDCNAGRVLQCVPNTYAELGADPSLLLRCHDCPPNAQCQGGLSESVQCKSGYATLQEAQQAAGSLFKVTTSTTGMCAPCDVGFRVRSADGVLPDFDATFVCVLDEHGAKVRTFCDPTKNKRLVGTQCEGCPSGTYVALSNPSVCTPCPIGHWCSGQGPPTACRPAIEFSDVAGASACKAKRTERCSDRHTLVLQVDDTNPSADNQCVPCPTSCGADGSISVFVANHNETQDPCTDTLAGRRFYACAPRASALMSVRGMRVTYHDNGDYPPYAAPEACDSKALPDWAEWVTHQAAGAAGTSVSSQCYFACTYGVRRARALAWHQGIAAAVRTVRADLMGHLTAAAPLSSGLDSTKTPLPLVWKYGLEDIGGNAVPATFEWTVLVNTTVLSARAQQYYDLNTFLFVDEFMTDPTAYLPTASPLDAQASATATTTTVLPSSTSRTAPSTATTTATALTSPRGSATTVTVMPSALSTASVTTAMPFVTTASTSAGGATTTTASSTASAAMAASGSSVEPLCYGPDEPVDSSVCPPGFIVDTDAWEGAVPSCGLLARQDNHMWQYGGAFIVVDAPRTRSPPACWSVNTATYQFHPGCKHCLDVQRRRLLSLIGNSNVALALRGAFNLIRVSRVLEWLTPNSWTAHWGIDQRPSFQPALSFDSQTCAIEQCRTNTPGEEGSAVWRYTIYLPEGGDYGFTQTNFSACLPCEATIGDPVCVEEFGAAASFDSDACVATPRPTLEDVCRICPLRANSVDVLSPNAGSSNDYAAWLEDPHRKGNSHWGAITCRYLCAEGYTSNPDVDLYPDEPCIPCSAPEVLRCSCDRTPTPSTCTAAYYTDPSGVYARSVCGGVKRTANRYTTYAPGCGACVASQVPGLVFRRPSGAEPSAYASLMDCLGKCDPGLFYTVLNTSEILVDGRYVAQRSIGSCKLCTDEFAFLCFGVCKADTFKVNEGIGTCRNCTRAPCQCPGGSTCQFRERCLANSTEDAKCVDCDPTGLRNRMPMASLNGTLLSAVVAASSAASRRWISCEVLASGIGGVVGLRISQHGVGACCAVCATNMVLINLTTGYRPEGPIVDDGSDVACVPCSHGYFTRELPVGANQNLYSVWNQSPEQRDTAVRPDVVQETGPLANMTRSNSSGACYACADDYMQSTFDDEGGLCVTRPGFTKEHPVYTNFDVNMTQFQTKDPAVYVMAGRTKPKHRRRLLQVSGGEEPTTGEGGVQVWTVRAYKQPAVAGVQGDRFGCCDRYAGGDPLQINRCVAVAVAGFEANKLFSGSRLRDYCTTGGDGSLSTPTGRRLMSAAEPGDGDQAAPCLAGLYKEGPGDGPCNVCPEGSTTKRPYEGRTHMSHCSCMGGFYRSNANLSEEPICRPCGTGRYRDTNMPEAECRECPDGMWTPTGITTSSNCYCPPGAFAVANASEPCPLCPPDHFCDGGVLNHCPDKSGTGGRSGARSRADCICQAGYYGSLGDEGQECFQAPPALVCSGSTGVASTASAACTCQAGWVAHYSRDDTASPAVVRKRCLPPCSPGQYAMVDEAAAGRVSTQCIPCPHNTYSGSGTVLYVPGKPASQQCTPCPANFVTLSEGSDSLDACVCPGQLSHVNGSDVFGSLGGLSCGGCMADTFARMTLATGRVECTPCPSGTRSPPGSVDILACVCPPGSRAVAAGADPSDGSAWRCEPCPRGFYTASVGAACTACPDGSTTASPGQTSHLACLCSDGRRPRNGGCPS